MKELSDFKEDIYKCSKCGLCQAQCPIYKITGNDCSVSRGQFAMLKGLLKGELKLTRVLNKYLDLCLKCGACSKFCPSGIDVVDIIVTAKSEYFRTHFFEKIISFLQKNIFFGFIPNFLKYFSPQIKSKNFEQKVLYFGGCGSKLKGNKAVIKILNSINVQVINPNFSCCGIPYFSRGDLENFNLSIKEYISVLKKYDIKQVVTTCASCEQTLKNYQKWVDSEEDREFLENIEINNIYTYLARSKKTFESKKYETITFHKPCHLDNYKDIKTILNQINNVDYVEMENFDECCGLNLLTNLKEFKIIRKLANKKLKSVRKTDAKKVLTACLGCEIALKSYSLGQYKTQDLIEYLSDCT